MTKQQQQKGAGKNHTKHSRKRKVLFSACGQHNDNELIFKNRTYVYTFPGETINT